jgi:hypothetical protein
LNNFGFNQFAASFREFGYVDPESWKDIEDKDLFNMGIKGNYLKKWKKVFPPVSIFHIKLK